MKVYALTEPHRHACECRYLAAMAPDWERMKDYVADVARLRGRELADKLREDTRALLKGKR